MSEHSTNLCVICHENINLDDLYQETIICIPERGGCGNFFHKNCVKLWCNTSRTKECPICRNSEICERLREEKEINEKYEKEPLRQREVHAMADAAARWRAYRRIIDAKLYIQIPEEISEETQQDIFSKWYTNLTPDISEMINTALAAARDETDDNMKDAYLRVIQHKEPGARDNMPTIEYENAHELWGDAHSRWKKAEEDARNEDEQVRGEVNRAISRAQRSNRHGSDEDTRLGAVEYAEDAEANVAKLKVLIEFYTDKAEIARQDVIQLEWRKKLSQTSSSELEELLKTYRKQVDDLLERLETLENEFYEARKVRDVMVADVAKDDFVILQERVSGAAETKQDSDSESESDSDSESDSESESENEELQRRSESDSESESENEELQRRLMLTTVLRLFGEDWESEPGFPLLSRENLERMPLHILREIRDFYQRASERVQNMWLREIPVTAQQREELEQRNEVESLGERVFAIQREVNTEVERLIDIVLRAQDLRNDMNTPASVERRLAEIRLAEDESSVSSDNQSGGMENLKPFNKEKLEKLDRYMPGAWDFVQMEKDRTDEMPLERSHQKFVCPDIYDKIDFLEGWMRKVINKFQPNNPNIHFEIRNYFQNLPPKIFNHDTLSRTIQIILGNTNQSEDAEVIIKQFLKNIAMGVVRLSGGIFQQGPIPQTVLEEMVVGPNPLGGNLLSILLSYRANDIFQNWDVEVQGHELEGYNINISEKRTGENPVGGLQGPIFFRINGFNLEHIEEDLPEILEGINVLKQQVARTCNVRSNRITRAGGKKKLLKYKYKKHLGGSDNFEEIGNNSFSDGEIQKFLGGMKPEDLTPEKLEELLSTYRVNNKIYEYLDIFDKKHPRFDCKSDESKLDELEKWMIHTLLTLQLTFEDASFYIGGRVIPNTPLRRDIYFSDKENVNETKLKTEEEIKNFIRDFKKQPSIEIKKLLKMFVSTTPRVHNHTGTIRHLGLNLVVVYNYYLFENIDWNSNPIRPYNRENSNDYRFGIGGLWSLRNGALNQRVKNEINAHKELKLNVSAFKKKLIRISCYRAEEKSRKRRLKKQEDIRMDDDSDDSAESLNSLFDKKLKLSGV